MQKVALRLGLAAIGALLALLDLPACGDDAVEAAVDDGGAQDASAVDAVLEPDAPASLGACGNGEFDGLEQCDDGNVASGDGCSSTCVLEPGWVCPAAGRSCRAAKCGDGIRAGSEQCDDGNSATDDGCTPNCRTEQAFACSDGGCTKTTCNDGVLEGREACDDKNNDLGDGCTPFCMVEPSCPYNEGQGGACGTTCGDGMHFDGDPEECDDGNRFDGDGCSKGCKQEQGFTCQFVEDQNADTLELPLVLRDFRMGFNVGTTQTPIPNGHVDFENNALNKGLDLGIVSPRLGADGKPRYSRSMGGSPTTTGQSSFDSWFRDAPGINTTVVQTMTLTRQPSGTFEFVDNTFYPLDGLGFGNEGLAHNFHFTSEVRHWFEYKGSEVLSFTGDDDVWVFIDKQLVIDLGGVHGAQNGVVTLSDGKASVVQAGITGTKVIALGLEVGKVYEVIVWQAERHTTQSNYRLGLSGFTRRKSACVATCGDGIVTANEVCDDGPGRNNGGYNDCNSDCQGYAPYCGDGIVQTELGEECDDGVNATPIGQGKCAPGCKRARL